MMLMMPYTNMQGYHTLKWKNLFIDSTTDEFERKRNSQREVINAIGLKIPECSISSYVRNLDSFKEFVINNSTNIIDILESSFTKVSNHDFYASQN